MKSEKYKYKKGLQRKNWWGPCNSLRDTKIWSLNVQDGIVPRREWEIEKKDN